MKSDATPELFKEHGSLYLGVYTPYIEKPKSFPHTYITEKGIKYTVNSHFFRTPEFNGLSLDKKNILIGGCSQTYGWELDEQYTWSNILTNKIRKKINADTYNLAYPGFSIHAIIRTSMAFIKKYGKPDYILFLLPNIGRDIFIKNNELTNLHVGKEDKLSMSFTKTFSYENALYRACTMLDLFETYCKEAGIIFHWTSWMDDDNLFYDQYGFENYFNMDGSSISKYEHLKNANNEKFWEYALDGGHFGYRSNLMIADAFYDKIFSDIN